MLEHYLFRARDGDMLLGLGVASLFNHSSCPSLDFRVDREHLLIRFFAARDIKVSTLSLSCRQLTAAGSFAFILIVCWCYRREKSSSSAMAGSGFRIKSPSELCSRRYHACMSTWTTQQASLLLWSCDGAGFVTLPCLALTAAFGQPHTGPANHVIIISIEDCRSARCSSVNFCRYHSQNVIADAHHCHVTAPAHAIHTPP